MRVGVVLVLICGACGSSSSPDSPDAGPMPELTSCFVGEFFADCGGDGAPVLACIDAGAGNGIDGGDCRWFTGGVVAAGYDPSPCPSDNLCCKTGSRGLGNWPYDNGAHLELSLELWVNGIQAWDRTRSMVIPVTIDSTMTAGDGTFRCAGSPPDTFSPSPCRDTQTAHFVMATRRDTIWISLGDTSETGGWYPLIEIDPATSMARVYTANMNDTISAQCPGGDAFYSAQSGTFTLSALPAATDDGSDLHGQLSVDFGTFQLTASF